jgi:UPF0755 protein
LDASGGASEVDGDAAADLALEGPAPDGPALDGPTLAEPPLARPALTQEDLARRRRARRRRYRRRRVLALVLVVVVVAVITGYFHLRGEMDPGGRPGPMVTVTLPKGASSFQIAHLLARADVIHGPDFFVVYMKLEGAGPLLAGTYRLPTNESFSTVLARLENGPIIVTDKLVVPEGFTVRQIAAAVGHLPGIGISAPQFEAAAMDGQVRSLYEPPGTKTLEGLLFPATYPVRQGSSADDLVQYMVDTFDYHASQLGLAAAARKLGYTPYQVVIVASIVEREAKLDQDRGPIASVIYNRLAVGMPIGAESTLLYGLGEPAGQPSITTPNRYNTLINTGLPPTAISNPGIPSLEAAMHPSRTSYLYWVEINPDGKMGFGTTPSQFKQLQRDCRKVHLC